MKHVSALLFLFAAITAFAQNGWYPITPWPATNPMYAAAALDTNTWIVAGDEGTVLRTTDRGLTWRSIRVSLNNLLGMTFLDSKFGIVFGEGGIILKTTDGGLRWSGCSAPPSTSMLSCSIFDTHTAYIVGVSGLILHSSDGGVTWQAKHSGTPNNLYHVSCVSPSIAFVAGDSGMILRTGDSGNTWKPLTVATRHKISFLVFLDTVHGFAGSYMDGNFQTTDGGAHWTPLNQRPWNRIVNVVQFFSPDSGILCADSIFTTANGGITWKNTGGTWAPPSEAWHVGTVSATQFANFNIGLEITDTCPGCDLSGKIHIIYGTVKFRWTTDGGVHWLTGSSRFGLHPFTCVAFAKQSPAGMTFCAYSDNNDSTGSFYHTTDAGATWTFQIAPTSVNDIVSIAMPDPRHATAVGSGGDIVHTSDAGAHWATQTSGTTKPLYGVAFADSANGFAVGGNIVIAPDTTTPDPTDSIAHYYRVILQTSDGGATWTRNYDRVGYYLTAIAMLDKNKAIGVGINGTITQTTNGGAQWSELILVDYPFLTAVSYADSAHITAVGNPWYITHSRDAGQNWLRQPIRGQSGYVDLTGVCFTDSANGTVVGMIGKILHTTNGGDSWNEQWSGVLSRFHGVAFADGNTGVVVGGAGEAWDTHEAPVVILRTTNANKPPVFSKDKKSIAFGNVKLGTTKFDSIVVVNRGQGEMIFKLVDPTNLVFNVNPSTTIIAPGDSMVFHVNFTPRNILMQTGSIQFKWFDDASPDSVMVSGWGSGGPALEWNREMFFGDVRVGTGKLDSVTLYNRGDSVLNISSITVEDTTFFPEVSTATIPAGDSLILRVLFAPPVNIPDTLLGRVSSITLEHNGVTSPDSIGVRGVGVRSLVTKKRIDFGDVPLRTTKWDGFGVFNEIAAVLTIDSIRSGNPVFTATPRSMNLGIDDTQKIKVSFQPRTIGPVTSTVIVYHNDHSRPDTVVVTGNGVGPVLTVSTRLLNFGKVLSGKTKIDSFQVANVGTLPLYISNITTGVLVFAADPDSLSLQPGGTAWIHVIYRPTTVVHSTGFVYLTNNAVVSPDSVALVGEMQLTDVNEYSGSPSSDALFVNYPNPATTATNFQFVIPTAQHVSLRVYSLLGGEVATLLNEYADAGTHTSVFNIRHLPTGVYRAVFQYEGGRLEKTLVFEN